MTDQNQDQPQDAAQRETVHDIVMKKIAGNPRFKLAPNPSEGFVIVGAKPKPPAT